MRYGIANIGGEYTSSRNSQAAVASARSAMADFLGCDTQEIAFGPSMTAVTFHLANSFRNAGYLKPGDNIVLDPISHGANVWTWTRLAKHSGSEIRWLPVAGEAQGHLPTDCILDSRLEALASVIDSRTKLVAIGAASNGVGTAHDITSICSATKKLSEGRALSFVDAVHYAPHARVDVRAIGCDFLACSPYKFFGTHSGVLFGRQSISATLPVDRLDCAYDTLPSDGNYNMSRWELGTQNYEALVGVRAAVDYVAGLGSRFGGADANASRSDRLNAAWRAIVAHEAELKHRFLSGAASIKKLRLLGVTDPEKSKFRTATFAVSKAGVTAADLSKQLCDRGIWCTAGNHYAGFWSAQSNGAISNDEGMTRLGLLHYNTLVEVDRILEALEAI
jgi:cysteine desulfurase family protein (TIGR01976 family)